MFKKYFQNNNNNNKGFTLIETMISVAIFIIIMVIGMTALLNASSINKRTQNQRSIMDSLNFIMDDMSRNIRTGSNFHCFTNNGPHINNMASISADYPSPLSCPITDGTINWAISFTSATGDKWVYYFSNGSSYNNIHNDPYDNLYKSTDGGATFTQLNPDEVKFDIEDNLSGFWVSGAESGDGLQPLVTIRLNGQITSQNITTPFFLQTSVSQRLEDL